MPPFIIQTWVGSGRKKKKSQSFFYKRTSPGITSYQEICYTNSCIRVMRFQYKVGYKELEMEFLVRLQEFISPQYDT